MSKLHPSNIEELISQIENQIKELNTEISCTKNEDHKSWLEGQVTTYESVLEDLKKIVRESI